MKEKRLKGKIKYWNGRKGFGFIEPDEGEGQVFVHIKAFIERKGKPRIGQELTYTLSSDDQGRSRAENVMDAKDDVVAPSNPTTMIIISVVIIVAAIAIFAIWG